MWSLSVNRVLVMCAKSPQLFGLYKKTFKFSRDIVQTTKSLRDIRNSRIARPRVRAREESTTKYHSLDSTVKARKHKARYDFLFFYEVEDNGI